MSSILAEHTAQSRKEYEDYFLEINDIRQGGTEEHPDEEIVYKTPDEGEQELDWLKETGYGHLLKNFEQGKVLDGEKLSREVSSLTKAQAMAVKKRVDTINATIRKRQKQNKHAKTDVRDIFPPDASVGVKSSDSASIQTRHSAPARRRNSGKKDVKLRTRAGYYAIAGGAPDSSNTPISVETLKITKEPEYVEGNVQSLSDADVSLSLVDNGADDMSKSEFSSGDELDGPSLSEFGSSEPDTTREFEFDGHDDSGLPCFKMSNPEVGTTWIDAVSKADLAKIRSLALIELTALFDDSDITYTRRRGKRRLKENGIFGVPLQTLLEHDQKKHKHLKVPLIFQKFMKYLEENGLDEEGILRVPGSASRIKFLRGEIEQKFNTDSFSWDEMRPNDAAGLLKQFLRELPTPLLTFEYLEAFAQVEKIKDAKHRLQALNLLILLLPDVNRNTLQMLLSFLMKVVKHEDNRMTFNSVGMIMAPNLFLVPAGRQQSKTLKSDQEINMAAGTSNIVKMLIKYQLILWAVPDYMVTQVRNQYEKEMHRKAKDKSIMKFLVKKDKSDLYKKPHIQNEAEVSNGVIRVTAPEFFKECTTVKLEPKMTAHDLIVHLCGSTQLNGRKDGCVNKRSTTKDGEFHNTYVWELGGNIGERRLDSSTDMLALLRVNPNAEWTIKTKPD